ncbi:MAG: Stp1/IreP family PP2C-type Ser/Thr phosphatase [Firmicutes bacterium]|nr:Stp1/IreP family PP2C-type Ser/Thr phosphatase [Bacillota bacterium]
MKVGAYSYIGGMRGENQDRYGVLPNLWIVADGMGGCQGGARAASLAVQVLSDFPFDPDQPEESIRNAMLQANEVIFQQSNSDPALRGMGTTLTLAYLVGRTVHIGHVGDSRVYLVRDHQIQQLTQDHSFVGELLRDGTITPEDALNHPNRNILTRAIGVSPTINVDLYTQEIMLADILVLCTDGVCGALSDQEILAIVESDEDPQRVAETMCREAERHGGTDNATAIVVSFLPPRDGYSLELSLEDLVGTDLTLV